MNDPHLPAIGTRFSLGSSRGTIRYVGEVPPTKGIWIGVEWDDASRGKHSGTRDNVCYFTCRVPGAGSFVKPSSKLSFGSSFLQALRSKYLADAENNEALSLGPSKQYTRKNLADIEVEAPNLSGVIQRSSQLHKLREVGLGGWKEEASTESSGNEAGVYAEVAKAFDHDSGEKTGDILATCPSIRSLDLSRSLLPSWLEVSKITSELPRLESLTLHWNRFEALSSTSLPLPCAFKNLLDLRIDGTATKWEEILTLSSHFPSLEILQMGSNNIKSLDGADTNQTLEKLRVLNLDGNALNDWNSLWSSLKACPKLERLILSSNDIDQIVDSDADGSQVRSLQHVSLWDNPIYSWSDLEALDRCVGGLHSLVLGGQACRLTKKLTTQDARLFAIARLASLQTFNNAPISAIERRDAELFYISHIAKQGAPVDSTMHPRWTQLCQIHETPLPNSGEEANTQNNGTLKSKLLAINVYVAYEPPCSAPPHVASPLQQREIKLLTTTPLRLLLSKLARILSLDKGARSIQSVWALLSPTIDPTQATAELLRKELRPDERLSMERIVYEMDNLERDLYDYNFSKGDEIVLVVGR